MQEAGVKSARFTVAYSAESPTSSMSLLRYNTNHNATKISNTSPADAKYLIVFLYHKTYDTEYTIEEILDTLQIEEGSTATAYEPFGYKIPIAVSGKNLFDKSDYQADSTTSRKIGFSVRRLKIGAKYTISSNKPLTWVKISSYPTGYASVQFRDTNGFYKYSFTMSRHSSLLENETQHLFLGNIVGETDFVNNISQLDGFDIQIEESTLETEYEPYKDLVYDAQPEYDVETHYLEQEIEEQETAILVHWKVHEIPME